MDTRQGVPLRRLLLRLPIESIGQECMHYYSLFDPLLIRLLFNSSIEESWAFLWGLLLRNSGDLDALGPQASPLFLFSIVLLSPSEGACLLRLLT